MQISDRGLNIIKEFEQLHLSAYLDPNSIPTIGWGHTGHDVHMGQIITVERATELLTSDVKIAVNNINAKVHAVLNQNQFDALCSFVFNVGTTNFNNSHLLIVINTHLFANVPIQMRRWDHGNGNVILPGLLRRREAEIALWNTP